MLQKMFLPQDYQEIQAARPVLPGERRIHTGFDFKSKFQAPVAMDILFSKNDVRICYLPIDEGLSADESQHLMQFYWFCFTRHSRVN